MVRAGLASFQLPLSCRAIGFVCLSSDGALGATSDSRRRFVVFCFAKPEDAEAFCGSSVASACRRTAGDDPENKQATRARCAGRTQGAERQLI
jgi:hypothetical protein